jgi:hypothetical protein
MTLPLGFNVPGRTWLLQSWYGNGGQLLARIARSPRCNDSVRNRRVNRRSANATARADRDPFETCARRHSTLRFTRRSSLPYRHCLTCRACSDPRQYFNETADGRREVGLLAVKHSDRSHPVKLLNRENLEPRPESSRYVP